MFVRLVQPLKAPYPMFVTLLGIVKLVIFVQPKNESAPMLRTLLGIVTHPALPLGQQMNIVWLLLSKQPFVLLKLAFAGSTSILSKLKQPMNGNMAAFPNLETLGGIEISTAPGHASKAKASIVETGSPLTDVGMIIFEVIFV